MRRLSARLGLLAGVPVLAVLGLAGPASALFAPLLFDGESRDDAPADGVFDSLDLGFPTADARIQNASIPGSEIEDRILLEFDLSGIPYGATLGGATLRLVELNDDGAPLELHGAAGDGVASTADAEISALLTGPTGTFGDAVVNTASIDVGSLIASLVAAGAPSVVFAIRGGDVNLGSANAIHYRILTSEGPGKGPRLKIVPEPSGLALAGLGLAALARAARPRRSP